MRLHTLLNPPQSPFKKGGGNRSRFLLAALVLATTAAHGAQSADQNAPDLTQLSIEQLLDTPVYTASRFTQKGSNAPSSVSVITAADIRTYGYRTLADIVRSVRGMYVTYDRAYSYTCSASRCPCRKFQNCWFAGISSPHPRLRR